MAVKPTWIVVADGGGARFFVRHKPGEKLDELLELAESADPVEQPAGKPARTHDRMGRSGHTIQARVSPREEAAQHFLQHIATRIDRAVSEQAVGQLVICAPPRAMGLLRDYISPATRQLLTEEITKDLLREPVADIDARMNEHRI